MIRLIIYLAPFLHDEIVASPEILNDNFEKNPTFSILSHFNSKHFPCASYDVLSRNRITFSGVHSPYCVSSSNPYDDIRSLIEEERTKIFLENEFWNINSSIPYHIRKKIRIFVYQNKGAYTGGTIALKTLFQRIVDIGFQTYLCNDTNYFLDPCRSPSNSDIVITGEWCNGVKDDYNLTSFRGRGIQYHLGFHHWNDFCRGFITVTDSHYLHASLAHRIRGTYYFGCEMAAHFKTAVAQIVERIDHPAVDMVPYEESTHHPGVHHGNGLVGSPRNGAVKEDLVVLDPDLMRDYPPQSTSLLNITLPPGTQYVLAQGMAPEEMVALLQRAKVVLDLAMPGPERLAGEGVLMGAVPIVSERWNGASEVDFSGLLRVNPFNSTDISQALHIAMHYYPYIAGSARLPDHLGADEGSRDRIIRAREGTAVFFAYILSLWRRAHHTADAVISKVHPYVAHHCGTHQFGFVLYDDYVCVMEEYAANLQILGLLYLFPLASVDLYTPEPLWYKRHHYAFYSSMKDAGYVRYDPFDPSAEDVQTRVEEETNADAGTRSLFRVRLLSELDSIFDRTKAWASGKENNPSLEDALIRKSFTAILPVWGPLVVVLSPGSLLSDSFALYDTIREGLLEGNPFVLIDSSGSTLPGRSACNGSGGESLPTVQDLLVLDRSTFNEMDSHHYARIIQEVQCVLRSGGGAIARLFRGQNDHPSHDQDAQLNKDSTSANFGLTNECHVRDHSGGSDRRRQRTTTSENRISSRFLHICDVLLKVNRCDTDLGVGNGTELDSDLPVPARICSIAQTLPWKAELLFQEQMAGNSVIDLCGQHFFPHIERV